MKKIIILISVLFLTGCLSVLQKQPNRILKVENSNIANDNIADVGGLDYNKKLEINHEVENIYYNSTNLPSHHTLCIPVKKYYCNIESCKSISPEVFNLIGGTRDNMTLSRCDKSPCNTYDVVFDDSGDYKVIQPLKIDKGFLFKMSYNTVDKRYVEVVTLGIDTYISYGYCKYDFEINTMNK